ncbi:two-component system OmpR family response regulator [Azospirillum lipoferum]|uniref:Regulatory protein VirG n=1 Tax=Azospirillum lipoferum TaxID=193 RepID=A0A5A9GIW5_AZOLI|nr:MULTISPECIES: response regulator transcription factor [Azospirillum]KAA0594297.1 response regulator transcription factor [Azospirillum lipoferum]MCP1613019.1 two-component system OmpR family response regulator [Azospirillum lipoferum]MDW5531219.1 response regulator transcription factor [Azospirillum sp. NL1]
MSSNTSPNGGRRLTIGVVDDDPAVLQMVTDLLTGEGYQTIRCPDAAALMAVLGAGRLDLIVLDLRLPDRDGISIAAQVRGTMDVPIIMLTGRGDDIDRIMGLEVGADDYIVKPFNNREFIARVKAVLRRTARESAPAPAPCKRGYRFAGFTLDEDGRRLFDPAGKPVPLTVAEFDLLVALVRAHGRVLSRNQILDLTHHDRDDVFDRTIDVLILRLRRKIERNPQQPWLIRTERGLGYVFDCDIEAFGH